MYNKRIICDLDDTISFCQDRNFSNATPNQPVIDKINELFDLGWEIFIVTARGCISCSTREEADKKYRDQIESWLKNNGVKYTILSFQKELAAYYVDDKAIRPDEFVALEIKNLQNGWSGATVELRGDKVYKTAPNSLEVVQWYKIAKSFDINVPKIHSIIGDTICMEYINPEYVVDPLDLFKAGLYLIETLKSKPFYGNSALNNIENYIDRLRNHSSKFNDDEMISIAQSCINNLISLNDEFDLNSGVFKSMCHGDLTLENMISSGGTVWFIDPIYEPTKPTYSSWILDLSKLIYSWELHSLQFDHIENFVSEKLNEEHLDVEDVRIIKSFVLSHCIRVFNYAPDDVKPMIKKIAKKYE